MPNRSEPLLTKLPWSGEVLDVQPRIDPMGSFDIHAPTHLGYLRLIEGTIPSESRRFTVRLGRCRGASSAMARRPDTACCTELYYLR